MPSEAIVMKAVGYVHRAIDNKDVRNREATCQIVIRKDLTDALTGIDDFSHIFVIFYMHQIKKDKTTLKVHPRGRADLPLLGFFATRTPLRPNPIGLTLVELIQRKGNILEVKGLDAFDKTPVLDLKPADSWDMPRKFRIPKWLELAEKEKAETTRKAD